LHGRRKPVMWIVRLTCSNGWNFKYKIKLNLYRRFFLLFAIPFIITIFNYFGKVVRVAKISLIFLQNWKKNFFYFDLKIFFFLLAFFFKILYVRRCWVHDRYLRLLYRGLRITMRITKKMIFKVWSAIYVLIVRKRNRQ